VFDLVYGPRLTVLLIRAEAAGCRVVEGIEMLVEQAAASFAIWTGLPAPVEIMRRAAHGALDEPVREAERPAIHASKWMTR
jgi:shikimate dehydrogenase